MPHLLLWMCLSATAHEQQLCVRSDQTACEPLQDWAGYEGLSQTILKDDDAQGIEFMQISRIKKSGDLDQSLSEQKNDQEKLAGLLPRQRFVANRNRERVHRRVNSSHQEADQQRTVALLSRNVQTLAEPPSCHHFLSGVDNDALQATLAHAGRIRPIASSGPLQALQQKKIFIAACLNQAEQILSHWTSELIRLLMALQVPGNEANFFVSVYESGSSDNTVEHLRHLEEHLEFIGIRSSIVTEGETRNGRQRIEYMADIRNKALQPLRNSRETYDHVLWLNDNIFCADGVLQLLADALPEKNGGHGADAVCGMDYDYDEFGLISGTSGQCVFYDKWVSHDIAGNNFGNDKPVIRQSYDIAGNDISPEVAPGPGNDKLEAGQPFQVFSCWNGMVVFDADIFQDKQISFRTNNEQAGECAASEAELIFRDMWSIGRGKVLVSPKAASAYQRRWFDLCAKDAQPLQFEQASPIAWAAAPKILNCCPLHRDLNFVEYVDCYKERWTHSANEALNLTFTKGFAEKTSSSGEHVSPKLQ